ncbi:MAG: hypothetical protein J6W64_05615 [Bacilli bacterium]|nr:hypothetical protein [Bacilli bacterium]
MKFENVRVFNFEGAFRGMRNPHNSWDKSLSHFGIEHIEAFDDTARNIATEWLQASRINMLDPDYDALHTNVTNNIKEQAIIHEDKNYIEFAALCPDDLNLAYKLITAGPEHRKFMRQIMVTVDITAPLYWWKEFDTYKVGTVSNSTSTMHTLTHHPIAIDSFEMGDFNNIQFPLEAQRPDLKYNIDEDFVQMCLIPYLEYLRQTYCDLMEHEKFDEGKIVWKELIRWLPESFLQKRTITMNYENLYEMCLPTQRRHHKLTEWSQDFMQFAHNLPYADVLLFGDETATTSR